MFKKGDKVKIKIGTFRKHKPYWRINTDGLIGEVSDFGKIANRVWVSTDATLGCYHISELKKV